MADGVSADVERQTGMSFSEWLAPRMNVKSILIEEKKQNKQAHRFTKSIVNYTHQGFLIQTVIPAVWLISTPAVQVRVRLR